VLPETENFELLRLAKLKSNNGAVLGPGGEEFDLFRLGENFPIRGGPRSLALFVEPVDRVVEDLLHKPVRTLIYVDPTDDLKENPHDGLPALVRICIPMAFPDVDRFEMGPEDSKEDRSPSRVLVLRVGRKDRPENFVL
jgi:hypothetical protein